MALSLAVQASAGLIVVEVEDILGHLGLLVHMEEGEGDKLVDHLVD